MFVIQHQPHRAGTDLSRELVACLLAHGSAFSRVGASGEPGAVHYRLPALVIVEVFEANQRCSLAMACSGLLPPDPAHLGLVRPDQSA